MTAVIKEINYRIEFFSFWHCGSGLAAGADLDERVIRDHDNLPFVPGRTVKGVLRDAAETLHSISEYSRHEYQLNGAVPNAAYNPHCIDPKVIFGAGGDDEGHGQVGEASFSDACLKERGAILAEDPNLRKFLYFSIASTAIGDDGIAKDHSLRKIEVVVPCTLCGSIFISDSSNSFEEKLEYFRACMSMVKRMGTGRSRGLGRCKIQIWEEA